MQTAAESSGPSRKEEIALPTRRDHFQLFDDPEEPKDLRERGLAKDKLVVAAVHGLSFDSTREFDFWLRHVIV